MATPGQIQIVAKHFVIAALWADCEDGTSPRATRASHRAAFDICKEFIDSNLELFNRAMACHVNGYGRHPDAGSAEAAFGHDLWLTMRHAGVGFWDRSNEGLPQNLGDALTAACHKYGEPSYYFARGWFHL